MQRIEFKLIKNLLSSSSFFSSQVSRQLKANTLTGIIRRGHAGFGWNAPRNNSKPVV